MRDDRHWRQAWLELVDEITRYVKYLQEMGIEEYDATMPMGADRLPLPPLASAARLAESGASDEVGTSALSESPSGEHITVKGESPMAQKKKRVTGQAQASLFGDLAPAESPGESPLPVDETLDDIRADIGECTRCKLHEHRTHIVFGEGNPHADLMFVGEGPGADEDATGRPFVGRAGQLLDRMIEAIGMKREQVYIANIVKCRPPGNREPEPDEVATCEPFLYRQINVIRPKLVVALGGVATKTLLRTKAPISKLRGRFFDFRGTKLLPTFHPAFLLRSPNKKRDAWEDLKKVRDFLQGKIVE